MEHFEQNKAEQGTKPGGGRRLWRALWKGVAALLLVGFCTAVALWWLRPPLTEQEVRETIVTTIQQEAPASFYVTGHLDVTVASTVTSTEVLLPGWLDLDVGTTRSTVRVPGRVHYGFDIRQLQAEDIRVREDGRVEVVIPELRVYAAEPELARMQVQTSAGWRRFYDSSSQRVERQALRRVQDLFREQAEEHLRSSAEPRIHTAEALEKLLTPVLQASGWPHPQFRFQIDERLVMEPGS